MDVERDHPNRRPQALRPDPREKGWKAMAKVRRSYGTGSLYVHVGRNGHESWYARWYVAGKRVRRAIGPKRGRGHPDGLTRSEAEAELRRLIESETLPSRVTVAEASDRMLKSLETLRRRPTTLDTYRSMLDTHLLPRLGKLPVSEVAADHIEDLLAHMAETGKAPKTRANAFRLAHQLFRFAQRRGWCTANPCESLESPRVEPNTDIRFLDQTELEALVEAVDTKTEPLGQLDRAIYLTAAMTGLRQGELLALRWGDVDWTARKIRVRRSYVRGHWSTPKTRRGSRAVPLGSRVKEELERLRERSCHTDQDDLVFGHPSTGEVLDHSKLVARFKRSLRKGGVREIRFHWPDPLKSVRPV